MLITPSVREHLVSKGFPYLIRESQVSWITEERFQKGLKVVNRNRIIVLEGDDTIEKTLYAGILCYYAEKCVRYAYFYAPDLTEKPDISTVGMVYLSGFDLALGYKAKQNSEIIVNTIYNNGGKVILGVVSRDTLIGSHDKSFAAAFLPHMEVIICPRVSDIKWKGVKL